MPDSHIKIMSDPQGFFTEGQRELIYNSCDTLFHNERIKWKYKTMIRLMWVSGRRISEVISLKVKDIDLKNDKILYKILKKRKRITIEDEETKHKRYKYVSDKDYKSWKSIDSKTMNILKYHIYLNDLGNEDYLFFNSEGKHKHMTRQSFDFTLRKLCKIANIHYVGTKRPHSHHFRHSFAVDVARTLKTPSDLIKLRNALEHSSIGMTEQYLQFSPEIKDTLEELYGEKTT